MHEPVSPVTDWLHTFARVAFMAKVRKEKNVAGVYTVEEIVRMASEKFPENLLMLSSQGVILNIEVIPTGCYSLDRALGVGGWPQGRIVELYGPESSGKTSICLHTVANAQKKGYIAAFIDTEHALDLAYARNLGVDTDKLLMAQPDCGEESIDLAEFLIRTGSVKLIIIDSVANLTPRAEIAGEMGESHMGLQARLMSQGCRKLAGIAKQNGCTIIFTNQIRMKIGVVYGNPEVQPGGRALRFYASVRVDIRSTGAIKSGSGSSEEVIGNTIKMKVVKNKMAPPFKTCESRIMYDGKGVDEAYDLLHYGVQEGYIEKKGAHYYYDGSSIGHGEANAIDYLKDNDDFRNSLRESLTNPDTEEDDTVAENQAVDSVVVEAQKMTLPELREAKKGLEKGSAQWKVIVGLIKLAKSATTEGVDNE